MINFLFQNRLYFMRGLRDRRSLIIFSLFFVIIHFINLVSFSNNIIIWCFSINVMLMLLSSLINTMLIIIKWAFHTCVALISIVLQTDYIILRNCLENRVHSPPLLLKIKVRLYFINFIRLYVIYITVFFAPIILSILT